MLLQLTLHSAIVWEHPSPATPEHEDPEEQLRLYALVTGVVLWDVAQGKMHRAQAIEDLRRMQNYAEDMRAMADCLRHRNYYLIHQ